jgi:NAD(P)-dependent dehydrogenase (short-subunit alcohol dehydrogenase family)
MMAVHAGGVLAGIRHAAPVMTAQGSGSIVAVASIGGRLGGWTGVAYAASKAAVLQIVRSAAIDLGEHGVRVNSVSPGPVLTGVFAKGAGIDPAVADRTAGALEPAFRAVLERWQPVRGAMVPDDVAAAAAWLAGDASRFVNGHDLVVDGGLSAGRPLSQGLAELPRLGAALMAAAGG